MWRLAHMAGGSDSKDKDKEIGYWIEKAAVAGHPTAMLHLGRMFMDGTYNKAKDQRRASDWLRKATRRRVERATELLLKNGYQVTAPMKNGCASPTVVQYSKPDEWSTPLKCFAVGDWGSLSAFFWQNNDAVVDRNKSGRCIGGADILKGRYPLDEERVLIVTQDFGSGGYGLTLEGENPD